MTMLRQMRLFYDHAWAELIRILDEQAEQMRRYSERPLYLWLYAVLFGPLFALAGLAVLITYLLT